MRFGPLTLGARLVNAGFALNISILSFRLPMLGALRDHSTAGKLSLASHYDIILWLTSSLRPILQ